MEYNTQIEVTHGKYKGKRGRIVGHVNNNTWKIQLDMPRTDPVSLPMTDFKRL